MLKHLFGEFTARQMQTMVMVLDAWRQQRPGEPFPLATLKRVKVYKRQDGLAEIELSLDRGLDRPVYETLSLTGTAP